MILVDDGLATGSTMRAAVRALRQRRPKRIVVAVPVGALESCAELRDEADEVVCAICPRHFTSVGTWYDDFRQTSDMHGPDPVGACQAAVAAPEDRPNLPR